MARKTIAETAREVLAEEGLCAVSWGDGILGAIATRAGMASGHPLKAMEKVLAALGRAPDLFEPGRLRGHDRSGRPRIVRTFRLRVGAGHGA
ncbi:MULTISPECIES: hypothetical protein [unclassified Xanthobacter]|uniref:hypothetical protein n=3 Tax=Xanthobacter TaxID=279 RepID=UPI001F2BB35F|nr:MULTISPECIES: hypothetical protein [unclassified Xanthobacter]